MTDTLSELKRIRAGCHQQPIEATENAISRLIIRLESDQELTDLMNGMTLSSGGLSFKLEVRP